MNDLELLPPKTGELSLEQRRERVREGIAALIAQFDSPFEAFKASLRVPNPDEVL